MKRALFFIGLILLLSGCAGIDPFLYRELPATDRSIEEARKAGLDTRCPAAFQEVVKLRNQAEAAYKECRTEEAIELAKAAQEKASALCPSVPLIDTDGDGVPDSQDRCPGTPRGVAVDVKGCPLDSDGDGVPDYNDQCPATPQGVGVNAQGCPPDSDGDGIPDYKDRCPGTPKGVKVDSKGCPLDRDGDGVYDYLDECPNTPKGAQVNAKGCWVLRNVEFDTDKWEIKPVYYPILNRVVEILKANPTLRVEIQGHTDNRGTRAYNLKLSENRAKAVKDYLVKKGIHPSRLFVKGYGFSQPVASNATAEGRAVNRRVQIKPMW
jgi:OOP family OmpA-OmpF porin